MARYAPFVLHTLKMQNRVRIVGYCHDTLLAQNASAQNYGFVRSVSAVITKLVDHAVGTDYLLQ